MMRRDARRAVVSLLALGAVAGPLGCSKEPVASRIGVVTDASVADADAGVTCGKRWGVPLPAELTELCCGEVGKAVKVQVRVEGIAETVPFVRIPAGCYWRGCAEATDKTCADHEKPGHLAWLPEYEIMETEFQADHWLLAEKAGLVERGGIWQSVWGRWSAQKTFVPPPWKDNPKNSMCSWYIHYSPPYEAVRALCGAMFPGGDLPSEAEWEKAARGGCETTPEDCRIGARIYPWGNEPDCCGAQSDEVSDNCKEDILPGSCIENGCRLGFGCSSSPGEDSELDVSVYGVRQLGRSPREVAIPSQLCISGAGDCVRAPDHMVGGTFSDPHDCIGLSSYMLLDVISKGGIDCPASWPGSGDEQSCVSPALRVSSRNLPRAIPNSLMGFRCVRRLQP